MIEYHLKHFGALLLILLACYTEAFFLESSVGNSPDRVLHRAKREMGFAPNHTDTLTVESYSPAANATSLKVGSQINFKLHSWWPKTSSDVTIVITMPTGLETETGNYPLFHLSKVKFESIGTNFKMNKNEANEMFQYKSALDSGQFYEAIFSLTNDTTLANNGATEDDGDSEITMTFYGVVSGHSNVTVDSNFYVLAGIHYSSTRSVWVARSAFTVTGVPTVNETSYGSLSISQTPSGILVDPNGFGVFTIEFMVKRLYEEVMFEVHGGIIGQTNILEIVDIQLDDTQGDSFEYVRGGKKTQIGNAGNYNNATRLEVGLVTNRLRQSDQDTDAKNVIRLLAVVKLPTTAQVGENFTLGVGVQTATEIYTCLSYVIAKNESELPHDYSPPTVHLYTTQKAIYNQSHMSVFANITFYKQTMARFNGFIQMPNTSIVANLVAFRVIGIGSALQFSTDLKNINHTFNSSDGTAYNDQSYLDFGFIFGSEFDSKKLWQNQLALEFEFYIVSGEVGAQGEIGFGVASENAVSVMAINITIDAIKDKSTVPHPKVVLTTANFLNDQVSVGHNQLAYLDVIYPAGQHSQEPIILETMDRHFAISKVETMKVGKHIRDAELNYNPHSAFSGSLYERMDIIPKMFITNIGRYDPPKWDEELHTIKYKIHLTLVNAEPELMNNITLSSRVGEYKASVNYSYVASAIKKKKQLRYQPKLSSKFISLFEPRGSINPKLKYRDFGKMGIILDQRRGDKI